MIIPCPWHQQMPLCLAIPPLMLSNQSVLRSEVQFHRPKHQHGASWHARNIFIFKASIYIQLVLKHFIEGVLMSLVIATVTLMDTSRTHSLTHTIKCESL